MGDLVTLADGMTVALVTGIYDELIEAGHRITAAARRLVTGPERVVGAREQLRGVNIQLGGAGTWDVRGQYTRQKVDLNAVFTGTTFTPALRLVPGLAGLEPSNGAARKLIQNRGLKLNGETYTEPQGQVSREQLQSGLVIQKGKDKFVRLSLGESLH